MGCRGPIQPVVLLSFTGLKDNVRDGKYSWPSSKIKEESLVLYHTICAVFIEKHIKY